MTGKFSDENFSNEDFEKLLEESINATDDFAAGDKVDGIIVFIGNEDTFVNISGKSEAVIDTAELKDKAGNLNYKKGDRIEAYIVSTRGGEIRLTFTVGRGEANPELLNMAYRNEVPVEGTVTAETKGGYTVSISGSRCFCPYSQIDMKASDDKSKYLNKSFSFHIIEYKENGRNIIVSRRTILEAEQKEKELKLKDSLREGDIVKGKILSTHEFGLFVDLGGIEALVPKSEISWGRNNSKTGFTTGEEISAKVISIDWASRKISLSIKQLTEEPWSRIGSYHENQTLNGKVVNIIPQGAFVELEPGIEGFLHISRMSMTRKVNKPDEVVKKGDTVGIKILSIDQQNRKLSLELLTGEADPWQTSGEGIASESHTGIVENVKNNGVEIRLSNGMLGFIPKGELLNSADIQKKYPAGHEIRVSVKEIDNAGKKLILSEKGALKKEEEKAYNSFINQSNDAGSSSLGNLFKDKFAEIQKQVKK